MRLLCMCKVVSTSVSPRDLYETQSALLYCPEFSNTSQIKGRHESNKDWFVSSLTENNFAP